MRRFDLVVIGSGPAGQRAAVQAAKLGKDVALVEKEGVVGGVCINTGTVPSKTLREAVLDLSGIRQRLHYGESHRGKDDIAAADLLLRTNGVMRREQDVIRTQLLRNGVKIFRGAGSFDGPNTVAVDDGTDRHVLHAPTIVIAVGTQPGLPRGIVVDHETILTSDDVLNLKRLPRSMVVVGAGIVGLEYATMFGVMGVHVTLIDKRSTLLDFVDREIVDAFAYHARERNVTMRLGEEVARIEPGARGGHVVVLGSEKRIATDMVLVSAGRVGATNGLALERAGVSADDRGRIAVNASFQTSQPHIYAVGDVIGFPALASTSMEQGRLAVCHAFGIPATSMTELYPFGVYAIPEIAWVGASEAKLTEKGVPFETGVARYKEIARGNILGDVEGMMKIVFHLETREILGVWALGTQATELVHLGQAVMAHGGKLDYFVDGVFNYPTLAECYKVAALHGANKIRALARAA